MASVFLQSFIFIAITDRNQLFVISAAWPRRRRRLSSCQQAVNCCLICFTVCSGTQKDLRDAQLLIIILRRRRDASNLSGHKVLQWVELLNRRKSLVCISNRGRCTSTRPLKMFLWQLTSSLHVSRTSTPGWVRADFGWTRRRHSCYGSARVSS